jgi:hypothetical protein
MTLYANQESVKLLDHQFLALSGTHNQEFPFETANSPTAPAYEEVYEFPNKLRSKNNAVQTTANYRFFNYQGKSNNGNKLIETGRL